MEIIFAKQRLMKESKVDDRSDVSLSLLAPGIEARIDDLCRRIGGREQAAVAAGVSAVMLRRYIKGESKPPFEVIANLAVHAKVSLDWVAFADTALRSDSPVPEQGECVQDTLGNPVDTSEFVFIPRYNVKAAAGHGSALGDQRPPLAMAFRRYWVDNVLGVNPTDLAVIAVKGDSMEGVLSDRDVILVNQAECRPGTGLYVLRMDGELFVKRIQRLPEGMLEISSANEAYRPFTISTLSPPSDFEIIGRVVWFGRQV